MSADRWRKYWRAAQAGWPPSYPLAQFPNAQLGAGLLGSVLARVTHGRAHDYASALAFAGLSAWAADELLRGVNGFRRVLGAAALVSLVIGLAKALR